jgi:hypothetical protein
LHRTSNACARVRQGFDKTSKAFLPALFVAIRASGFNYLQIDVFHGGNTGSNRVVNANPLL